VRRVSLESVAHRLHAAGVARVAVLVRPGDFAGLGEPLVEAWPADRAGGCEKALDRIVVLANERDLHQDLGFGFRQLTDTAIRALSPSINDPTTAVTCIGYLRSLLVRVAQRGAPRDLRELCGGELRAVVLSRGFAEYLDGMTQIGRYVGRDAWVGRELLLALGAAAQAAEGAGRPERARMAVERASAILEAIVPDMATAADRAEVERAAPAPP